MTRHTCSERNSSCDHPSGLSAGRHRFAGALRSSQGDCLPEALARRVASLEALFAALDIVEVAGASQQPVEHVAGVYFDLATQLGLPELRAQISALPGDQHWQGLARGALLDDLTSLQRIITGEALNGYGLSSTPRELVSLWQAQNQRPIERAKQLLAELKNTPSTDVSMLSVVLRELRHLA